MAAYRRLPTTSRAVIVHELYYALFSKAGFTAALQSRAGQERVILADLEQVANP